MSIKIDIDESQRSLIINFICDWKITEWVEKGKKLANGKYRISLDGEQIEDIRDYLLFLGDKDEYKSTRKELLQLADYLEEYLMEEF